MLYGLIEATLLAAMLSISSQSTHPSTRTSVQSTLSRVLRQCLVCQEVELPACRKLEEDFVKYKATTLTLLKTQAEKEREYERILASCRSALSKVEGAYKKEIKQSRTVVVYKPLHPLLIAAIVVGSVTILAAGIAIGYGVRAALVHP